MRFERNLIHARYIEPPCFLGSHPSSCTRLKGGAADSYPSNIETRRGIVVLCCHDINVQSTLSRVCQIEPLN